MDAFFTAIKLTVNDKDLPMEVSVFKDQHLKPAYLKLTGETLNFKGSSWKKIG